MLLMKLDTAVLSSSSPLPCAAGATAERSERNEVVLISPTRLHALAADAPCELHVFRHDGDAPRVDGAQVCVFEEEDEIRLGGLLQRCDGCRLEAEVAVEVLRDLLHQPLEGLPRDEAVGGVLEPADLAQRYGAWAESVRLYHPDKCWRLFSDLFPRSDRARHRKRRFLCGLRLLYSRHLPLFYGSFLCTVKRCVLYWSCQRLCFVHFVTTYKIDCRSTSTCCHVVLIFSH